MASDLREFVRSNPCKGFESRPYYSMEGDFLTFYFRNADHYAHRVDSVLTVYLSMDDKKLVGFKVKGVRYTLGAFTTLVECPTITRDVPDGDETVELRIFLVPGMAQARDPEKIGQYKKIAEATKDIRVSTRELQLV